MYCDVPKFAKYMHLPVQLYFMLVQIIDLGNTGWSQPPQPDRRGNGNGKVVRGETS